MYALTTGDIIRVNLAVAVPKAFRGSYCLGGDETVLGFLGNDSGNIARVMLFDDTTHACMALTPYRALCSDINGQGRWVPNTSAGVVDVKRDDWARRRAVLLQAQQEQLETSSSASGSTGVSLARTSYTIRGRTARTKNDDDKNTDKDDDDDKGQLIELQGKTADTCWGPLLTGFMTGRSDTVWVPGSLGHLEPPPPSGGGCCCIVMETELELLRAELATWLNDKNDKRQQRIVQCFGGLGGPCVSDDGMFSTCELTGGGQYYSPHYASAKPGAVVFLSKSSSTTTTSTSVETKEPETKKQKTGQDDDDEVHVKSPAHGATEEYLVRMDGTREMPLPQEEPNVPQGAASPKDPPDPQAGQHLSDLDKETQRPGGVGTFDHRNILTTWLDERKDLLHGQSRQFRDIVVEVTQIFGQGASMDIIAPWIVQAWNCKHYQMVALEGKALGLFGNISEDHVKTLLKKEGQDILTAQTVGASPVVHNPVQPTTHQNLGPAVLPLAAMTPNPFPALTPMQRAQAPDVLQHQRPPQPGITQHVAGSPVPPPGQRFRRSLRRGDIAGLTYRPAGEWCKYLGIRVHREGAERKRRLLDYFDQDGKDIIYMGG